MTAGVLFAIATCALWALSFVSPVVLERFSPYAVTLGRYATFGIVSLALVPFALRHVRTLAGIDWTKAAWLAIVGHLAYYLFLATGIQLSDVPGPTVIIGLLPLTVPAFANLRERELPWRTLLVPLLGIAAGLLLVHAYELSRFQASGNMLRYAAGIGFAFAALTCWTWYGIVNAAWLRSRPHVTATGWTLAQGITLLPVVLPAAFVVAEWDPAIANATHEDWRTFTIVSLIVGIGSTWLATLCWSQASRLLPTTLAGQLIAVVTIAAVLYGSIYRAKMPPMLVIAGVLILVAAVVLGVRAIQRQPTVGRSSSGETGARSTAARSAQR